MYGNIIYGFILIVPTILVHYFLFHKLKYLKLFLLIDLVLVNYNV